VTASAAPAAANRSKVAAWRLAARPPTLTASVAPVLVGCGLAIGRDVFAAGPAIAALLAALCLQVGANLANDVFDFERGADTAGRLGPPRATQMGMLSPREVRTGMAVVFGVALALGLYLAFAGGWPIVVLGLVSIAGAVFYTGGPWPFGYHGLGDLATFCYFGPVAVGGTYYVQERELPADVLWLGMAMGAIVTAILVVNNLRDRETDAQTGKRTLAVVLGDRATRGWYVALLAAGPVLGAVSWPFGSREPWVLLGLGAAPLLARCGLPVWRGTSGRALNPLLKLTARATLVLGVLLAVGAAL